MNGTKRNIGLLLIVAFSQSLLFAQNFTEVSLGVGVDHIFRHSGFIGGGVAFLDTDNDGDDDLYITSGRDIDQFYINNGDGTFTLQSIEAGLFLTSEFYTTGVAFGDVNRDGFQDIFVTTRGDVYNPFGKNFLFLNQKNNTFLDIWGQLEDADFAYSIGATLFDYDADGLLDIYVVNYVDQSAFLFDDDDNIIGYDHTCFENLLYRNIDGIQFERIDGSPVSGSACSLALCATDVDLDSDQDIFVANDFGEFLFPNTLYQNDNGEGFINSAEELQMDQAIYGMGICNSDYNHDGLMDYYVSNLGSNLLLENQGGVFENIAIDKGVDDTWFNEDEGWYSISWGCLFADFDNNSYSDLYVANGWVSTPDFIASALNQNDVYFSNTDGQFVQEEGLGIENTDVSRGVAYSDYDNDGDLDILVVSQNVPISFGNWQTKLYRNDADSLGNYLQINLVGYLSNTNGFGSKVTLHFNGQKYYQELVGASSHCSQNSSTLHFGLDTISSVDTIVVDWLGDIENDTIYNVFANQRITIYEDSLATALDTMALDTSTAIFNQTFSNYTIRCFPNPTQTKIHLLSELTFDDGEVEVIDVFGKIRKIKLYNNTFDVKDLDSGYYVVRVNNKGRLVTSNFIKIE